MSARIPGFALLAVLATAAIAAQMTGAPLSWRYAPNAEGALPGPLNAGDASGSRQRAALAAARSVSVATHAATRHVRRDVDGDGKSDLLLEQRSMGLTAYWRMDGSSPVAYSPAFANPEGYRRIATGDFNGDGKLDIVWDRAADRSLLMWLGDGNGYLQAPVRNYVQGWRVTGAGDVDGDGRSDLLLANSALGGFAYWTMDGATPIRYSPVFKTPAGFTQVASGDFNGDGRLDLVWARPSDRTLLMWRGDGNGFTQVAMPGYASGWSVSAAGDVDGDGKSDLLLSSASRQHLAYWIMDGVAVRRYSAVFALPDSYLPVTHGDYDGDGRLDLVLVRASDRTLTMWRGDGVGFSALSLRDYSVGWALVDDFAGVIARGLRYTRGDMDGDGKSDLVMVGLAGGAASPSAPGKFVYYRMDGPAVVDAAVPQDLGCTTARVLVTGDFDGNGMLDIVFRRDCDGDETVMRMNAHSGANDVVMLTPAAGWEIIGAGDVDGDGRSDLLLGRRLVQDSGGFGPSTGTKLDGFAYWIMEGATVRRFSVGFLPDPARPWLAASGDFDGNGKLDLVWHGGSGSSLEMVMWKGDGNGYALDSVPAPAQGWSVFGAGDVDGDGRSDLLLAKGGVEPGLAYWIMAGNVPVQYSPGFLYPQMAYGPANIAIGDYNGDGLADLVFPIQCSARNCPVPHRMWIGDGNGYTSQEIGSFPPAYLLINP